MPFLGPSLRRRRVTDRPAVRTAAAVLASLALNALIVLVLARSGAFDMPKPGSRPRAVALAPLSAEQWASNRAVGGVQPPATRPLPRPQAQPLAPPPPAPPPEEEKRAHGQVVNTAPPKEAKKPKDSRFLAEHDSTVEKETRSRDAGRRRFENVLPTPSDGPRPQPPAQARGEEGTAAETRPGKEGQEQHGTGADRLAMPKQPAQDKLALAPRPDGAGGGDVKVAPRDDRQRIPGTADQLQVPGPAAPEGGGQKKSGPISARLLPDPSSMARIAGGPAPDLLEGVDEGEGTFLNTTSFKYATYLNRVNETIGRQWDPERAYVARDPEFKTYPVHDRITDFTITLDANGQVQSVRILRSCGLEFLDQEIVRAVRTAGPFPNPPPGLAGPDGKAEIGFRYAFMMGRGAAHYHVAYPPRSMQQPYPE